MSLLRPSVERVGPDGPPRLKARGAGPAEQLWEQRLTNLMLWQLLTPEQQETVCRQAMEA